MSLLPTTVMMNTPVAQVWIGQRPRRVRGFKEFAEEEIILPTGPRAGMRFLVSFMPWTGLVLDEFTRGTYRRYVGSGPTQSWKTLGFFQIPAMYHLFEIGEPVILGAPTVDLARDIYMERLLPMIEKSRYKDLLPRRGAGSKRGKVMSIRFENGVTIRFMGAGGGDVQRSSHTARVVLITEMDKMDTAGGVSREADPITQIEARTDAFGDRARIYGECTMSTEEGRVYREVVKEGTYTQVYIRCPHCRTFIAPSREQFIGWQGVDDVMEAREQATLACNECGAAWSEEDRDEALKEPHLVSEGQSIDRRGKVTGEHRRTSTFGLKWTAIHSPLTTMALIGEKEWRAEHSDIPNAMKEIYQFIWAMPYQDDLTDLSALGSDSVINKISHHPRGVVPDGCIKITVTIDLGKYYCDWMAKAWRSDGQNYTFDYGALEVPSGGETSDWAILSTLRAFRDDVLKLGWAYGSTEGPPAVPDLVLVDSGNFKDPCYKFVKESGQERYRASKGFGTGKNQPGWSDPKRPKKSSPNRRIGQGWILARQPENVILVEMHSDAWKRVAHQGWAAPAGAPGSAMLFAAEKREHVAFAKQICAETEREEFTPGKGISRKWVVRFYQNHKLDCDYASYVAASLLGINVMGDEPDKIKVEGQSKQRTGRSTSSPGWKIGR